MLELIPKLDEAPISEVEGLLEQARTKRLSLLFEYQQAQSAELAEQGNRVQERLAKQTEMLGKELVRLDKLLDKCEQRVNNISSLRDELELINELQSEIGQ